MWATIILCVWRSCYIFCVLWSVHLFGKKKCEMFKQQKNGTTAFIWINNYWASTRVSNTWKLGRELWVKSRTPNLTNVLLKYNPVSYLFCHQRETSIQKCTMNTRAAVPHLLLLGWMICPVLKGIEKYSQHCPY